MDKMKYLFTTFRVIFAFLIGAIGVSLVLILPKSVDFSIDQAAFAYAILFALFIIKHFIADGPLQTSYQYLNKGKFGHIGGIFHSGIHAAFTFAVLMFWSKYFAMPVMPIILLSMTLMDFVIHYLCDWGKVKITSLFKWSSVALDENGHPSYLKITSNNYFIALLADQAIHGLTYVAIFYIIVRGTT